MTKQLDEFTFYRGRVGLHAILRALDVGPGDEVITQAYTCVAVPEAILATGARPIYADILRGGVNLDPQSVADQLSSKTRAIIVQHTFGIPAEITKLRKVAGEIPLIEDCCHAVSGSYHGEELGSFGVASFYSFEWGKPIVAGVGGSVRINDDLLRVGVREIQSRLASPSFARQLKLAAQLVAFGALYRPSTFWRLRSLFRLLSSLKIAEGNYAADTDLDPESPEFSLDMAPLQKFILRRRQKTLEADASRRRKLAAAYLGILPDRSAFPVKPEDCDPVLARFPVYVRDKKAALEAAEKQQIEIASWYESPIHPLGPKGLESVGFRPGTCPIALQACRSIISFPMNGQVGDAFVKAASGILQGAPQLGLPRR